MIFQRIKNTALICAIKTNQLKIASNLIAKGADINVQNKNGNTLLHKALSNNHINFAKYLIEKGADINVQNNNGMAPLHIALANNDVESAKHLIEKGADTNVQNEYGETLLHKALSDNHINFAKYLIEKGADINVQNNNGMAPLHIALNNRNVSFAKYLIAKGADINVQNEYGETPLHIALANNDVEFAKYLIEKGADINVQNEYGETPLHRTLANNCTYFAKYLIEKGVDVNVQNNNGMAPLHIALNNRNVSFAKYLIKKGADINVQNEYGETPLHRTLANNCTYFAKYLIKKGADISVQNEYGETPLHIALANNDVEFAKYLIEKGADINVQNKHGDTPLLIASQFGFNNLVEEIVKAGTDLSVINSHGDNILIYYQDEPKMVELLMSHGLDYNLMFKPDTTMLSLVNQNQSSHNINFISKIYSHFMDATTSTELQQGDSKQYISALKKELQQNIISDSNLEFKNLFLELVQHKLRDCIDNKGQGDNFVKVLLSDSKSKVSMEEIKNNQCDLDQLTAQFKEFIFSQNSEKYFNSLVEKALNIAKELQQAKEMKINNNTIKTDLIIPLIQKVATEKEIYPDIMNKLSIELIDAATMYASGGGSCITGTLSKLATILIDQIENINDQNKVTDFPFKGFLVNFNELLETILKFDKDNKIKPDQELSSLDAQQIRSFIYKIMKTDSISDQEFLQIVYYGETENVLAKENNIKQFHSELTYEMLSEIQQKVLVRNDENLTYAIPKEYLSTLDGNIEEIPHKHDVTDKMMLQQIITKLYDFNDDTGHPCDALIERLTSRNCDQLNLAAAAKLDGEDLVSFLGETLALSK